ncbi:MAG: translational GTPase TypA [Bdellovibrionales bacterium]|nr:translational GTPase TypA [Bdellovibrionales bacterium]
MSFSVDKIRNIAIIAHVDHGKTTLVDGLLRQAGTFRSNESVAERAMDSMDLERERGITIAAKNTAVLYKDYKINIVDTPGHADFGGEVERILSMVDGACLLVDAAEGPLPQTRFVLRKAMERGLKVMVVINKIDRQDARPQEVLNEVFNLFIDLEATDEQCDFPVVYAIAREGKAFINLEDRENSKDLVPLFDKIIEFMPPPNVDPAGKLQMLIANLSYSDYLGRLAVGRITSGRLKVGEYAAVVGEDANGKPTVKVAKVQNLFTYHGLKQVAADEVSCGDIAVMAGIEDLHLGDTMVGAADPSTPASQRWDPVSLALPRIKVDEPTLKVEWLVNSSPFAGKEGAHVTSRKIRDRLMKETLTNMALRFQDTDSPDRFVLMGRGELQIAILAEVMRREGYEFALGQPQILFKEEGGVRYEPMEMAILDIPERSQGAITQMFQLRKGLLHNIVNRGTGRVRLEIKIPTRGLIGLRSRFLTETRGEGLLNFQSAGYEPFRGEIPHRLVGALVADRAGDSNAYALETLQERGILFIGHGEPVYEGMVIGECAKENDLDVNPCKAKQLTNFRTVNKDDAIVLTPPRRVTIEGSLEWIGADELLEITPKSLRVRKRGLSKNQR